MPKKSAAIPVAEAATAVGTMDASDTSETADGVEAIEPVPPEPSLFDQVVAWVDRKEWNYEASDTRERVSFSLMLTDSAVRAHCWIHDVAEWKRLAVTTVYYMRVPAHRRAEVALALARINCATLVGCFEMDPVDGEVHVRTWHESELPLTDAMLDRVIRRCLDLADQFQAALLAIAFGNAPAADVVEMGQRAQQAALQ